MDLVLGDNDEIIGVEIYFGVVFKCKVVILIMGIFFGGVIWVGNKLMFAGCVGEFVVIGLSEILNKFGFEIGWLKIGIFVRVDKCFVDYIDLEV